jgi:sulfide:quinone oxidoreductase
MSRHKPHILVLGGNFAGLTAARLVRERVGAAAHMTLIDRKPYLIFVPNIPLAVLSGDDPSETLHMPIGDTLEDDDITFIQADVIAIDVEKRIVTYRPNERPGAACETIGYDYLIVALGARLDDAKIEGFDDHGHTVSESVFYIHSDASYGNGTSVFKMGHLYYGMKLGFKEAYFLTGGKPPAWGITLTEIVAERVP